MLSVLAVATCTAVGNTSLEDWDAFTWSFGWTRRPSRAEARVAITSFAFMFVDVPEPVWKTSSGKCSKRPPSPRSPSAISAAAPAIASAMSASMTPRSALTAAAAALIRASAMITSRGIGSPEIALLIARCVWAAHRAACGTWTSPIESCSVRNLSCDIACSLMVRLFRARDRARAGARR